MLCRILTICPFKCFILLSLWLLENNSNNNVLLRSLFVTVLASAAEAPSSIRYFIRFLFCWFIPFHFSRWRLIVPHAVCTVFTQKLCIFRESECESERERYFIDSLKKDALVFRIHFVWACVHCSLLSPQSQFNDYIYRFVWINKSDE